MKPGFLICITILFLGLSAHSQQAMGGTSYSAAGNFIEMQRRFERPGDAMKRKEDTLQKQFENKKLQWPAKYIYIRSFKYDSELEVWVKNEREEPYKLFKKYKVCALAGTLGPKRLEGDYQVPEGFYLINEFNPKSNYHLSLGLNYPNISDRILSDSYKPGGAIFIHGSCVTVGCIPLTDPQIEEVYILAAHAYDQGQEFIPVHIYPIRFDKKRSEDYLEKLTRDDHGLKEFSEQLEGAYYYFEKYKQLPLVATNDQGKYIVQGATKEDLIVKRIANKREHEKRDIAKVADFVHKWPQFPGGGDAFLSYLNELGREMVEFLPIDAKKAQVQVEFIIDKDGTPVNFTVTKGVDEYFDEELITRLEKMPQWKPALLQDKPVAKKIRQSFEISAE